MLFWLLMTRLWGNPTRRRSAIENDKTPLGHVPSNERFVAFDELYCIDFIVRKNHSQTCPVSTHSQNDYKSRGGRCYPTHFAKTRWISKPRRSKFTAHVTRIVSINNNFPRTATGNHLAFTERWINIWSNWVEMGLFDRQLEWVPNFEDTCSSRLSVHVMCTLSNYLKSTNCLRRLELNA